MNAMRKSACLMALWVLPGLLAGCSSLLPALLPSLLPPLSPVRSEEGPRQLHVTLVGGAQLNNSGGGPRPVQVCLYVAREASWTPSTGLDDSLCVQRGQEITAEARQVIAPGQVQQVLLPAAGSDPVWLLVDADFAAKPPGYAPLRIRVDGRKLIHLAVQLERNRIVDALTPPVTPPLADGAPPVADKAPPIAETPAALPERKPARRPRKAAAVREERNL